MNAVSFEPARTRMIEQHLLRRGIDDPRVIAAMREVPRERFVDASQIERAYDDTALPIGLGQTISQPFTVAFMAHAAQLKPSDRVLEIGTGSGYGAAVLSRLADQVWTIERWPELAEQARRRLHALGYQVRVLTGDGLLGLPECAPFDAIVVTAAAESIPPAYLEQLADGGRLVIPVGSPLRQRMLRLTKRDDMVTTVDLGAFAFVPLVGSHHAPGHEEGEPREWS